MTRPPRDVLLTLKQSGWTDVRISEHYGVHLRTVCNWRRRYDMRPDGSDWPRPQCKSCEEHLSEFLRNGMCNACDNHYKLTGEIGRKPPRRKGSVQWCTRCRERKAQSLGLCEACWAYQDRHGKPRPWRLIHRGVCKHCGGASKSGQRKNGVCKRCYEYKKRFGKDRPERLWAGKRQCDCGRDATHFDVALGIGSFSLCDSCFDLEFEPVITKGEATWQR